ncbi:adenylate/guanylate cyclase domain-containing protein [Shimia sp.]|uniref:adenylate/guanylate cyclase domain-containing protein n=1 Tax=Shimia sp. TaxID=1954381 RepID=UPI0032980C85
MIEPSPELMAVSRRWFQAVTVTRKDSELQNFLSTSAYLRFIGTAENERWFGPAVRQAIGDHFHEVPTIFKTEEILGEAFENGPVGWCCFLHKFWFETRPDDPVTFRTTLVFALEDGSWKIVQRHASTPVANQIIIGNEHSAIQALSDAAQQGFALGQREGLASVMFTDIVDSATLAGAVGDRRWSALVATHFVDLRQIIEAHQGQFVKSLGDGTMSSFSSAKQALSAAIDIQRHMQNQTSEPTLALRIGLHTGDVVQSDDDFFGNVVNKAARVTAAARPDTIRLSGETRAMVGNHPDFRFSDAQATHLKGFDGDHLTHELAWRA